MIDRVVNFQELTIAPNVYVCVTGDGSVILDLKRDKYLGLAKKDTELLAAVIHAWPKPRWDCEASPLTSPAAFSRIQELCRSLAADRLLVPGKLGCASVSDVQLREVNREWISIGDELEVEAPVTFRHVLDFAAAFIWARGSLALRPFRVTVQSVQVRKARYGVDADLTHMLRVASLVGIFRRLRPFVFAAEGRCLLHALTLFGFMNRYGFYPEWVIGVATQPWGAHSWVQWGNFLLDTNPVKVCRFTPILVV